MSIIEKSKHEQTRLDRRESALRLGDLTIMVSLCEITPELAAEYLALGRNNRKLKPKFISGLSRTISAGHWLFDANPIRFNELGELIDGQNRLEAIKKSGESCISLVVLNVPDNSFSVIDSGTTRTGSDSLFISGKTDPSMLATALSIVFRDTRNTLAATDRPSNQELVALADQHPGIYESMPAGRLLGARIGYSRGAGAAMHYLASRYYSPGQADEFFKGLAIGENLKQDSPAYRLREIVLGKKRGEQFSQMRLLALTIKAFKMFAGGRACKLLRFIDGEEFPKWID